MPLPVLAVIAARLGIAVGRYLIKKGGKEVLKKGAAIQLRNRIAAKAAKKATKRTSRPPTKAQIEATKARNRSKETISRRKNVRNVAKGYTKNVDTLTNRTNAQLFRQTGVKQSRIDKFLNRNSDLSIEKRKGK